MTENKAFLGACGCLVMPIFLIVVWGIYLGVTAPTPQHDSPVTASDNIAQQPMSVSARPQKLGVSRDTAKTMLSALGLVYQEGQPVNGEPNLVGQSNASGSFCHVQMVGPVNDLSSIAMTVTSENGNQNTVALSSSRLVGFVAAFAPSALNWLKDNFGDAIKYPSLSTNTENAEVVLQAIAATDGFVMSVTINAR